MDMDDSDLNALILDYLTNEGYPAAAERFSKEARLPLPEDAPSIQARKDIQQAIHTGSIQSAIEAINELNNQVCNSSSTILPLLQRLKQFMHHSYSLRVVDEKKYHTSVLSMSKHKYHCFTVNALSAKPAD